MNLQCVSRAGVFSYPGLLCQSLLLVHFFGLAGFFPLVLFLLLLLGGHESLQELFDYAGLNGDDALAKIFQVLHVFQLFIEDETDSYSEVQKNNNVVLNYMSYKISNTVQYISCFTKITI